MFDINGSEFLVIAVIAVILVGPERLPEYVRGLRALVKRVRAAVHDGQTALRSEFGDDVDWESLDPRQYDPRKIVRDALFDDSDATPATGTAAVAAAATGAVGTVSPVVVGSRRERRSASGEQDTVEAVSGAPFDDEAT